MSDSVKPSSNPAIGVLVGLVLGAGGGVTATSYASIEKKDAFEKLSRENVQSMCMRPSLQADGSIKRTVDGDFCVKPVILVDEIHPACGRFDLPDPIADKVVECMLSAFDSVSAEVAKANKLAGK